MLLFFGVFLCGGVAGHRFRDMASGVSETKGAGLSPGHCHVEKTGITRCREFRVSLSLSLTFWRRLRLAPQPGLKGPFTLSDCSFFDTSPFRPCLFYVPSELAFLVPPLQPLHWIPSFRTKRENHVPSPKKPPPQSFLHHVCMCPALRWNKITSCVSTPFCVFRWNWLLVMLFLQFRKTNRGNGFQTMNATVWNELFTSVSSRDHDLTDL